MIKLLQRMLAAMWFPMQMGYLKSFQGLERLFRWIAHHSDPTTLGRVCISVTVVACAIACFTTNSWVDWFSVAGFFVTITGFVYTIYQLFQNRSMADAESEGRRRQHAEHYTSVVTQTRIMLTETQTLVQTRKWAPAALRASDVSQNAMWIQVSRQHANNRWKVFADQFHDWSLRFRTGKTNQQLEQDLVLWETLTHEFSMELIAEINPTQHEE